MLVAMSGASRSEPGPKRWWLRIPALALVPASLATAEVLVVTSASPGFGYGEWDLALRFGMPALLVALGGVGLALVGNRRRQQAARTKSEAVAAAYKMDATRYAVATWACVAAFFAFVAHWVPGP